MDELDIPDECWDAPPIGDLDVGDVCEMVPLAVLVEDRAGRVIVDSSEIGPEERTQRYVPVLYSFALVIGEMLGRTVVVAIGTSQHIPPDDYERLVDTGRRSRTHLRLPPIPHDRWDAWGDSDGIAFFSLIEAFPTTALLPLRVASMTDDAREILKERVRLAVSYDD